MLDKINYEECSKNKHRRTWLTETEESARDMKYSHFFEKNLVEHEQTEHRWCRAGKLRCFDCLHCSGGFIWGLATESMSYTLFLQHECVNVYSNCTSVKTYRDWVWQIHILDSRSRYLVLWHTIKLLHLILNYTSHIMPLQSAPMNSNYKKILFRPHMFYLFRLYDEFKPCVCTWTLYCAHCSNYWGSGEARIVFVK